MRKSDQMGGPPWLRIVARGGGAGGEGGERNGGRGIQRSKDGNGWRGFVPMRWQSGWGWPGEGFSTNMNGGPD